jgi:hypothetical protein
MPRMFFKNTFGAQGNNLDLQRQDLFKFTINLPTAIGLNWGNCVEFAVEKFPFPARTIETIPVKYMQQTNFLIGADAASTPIEVPVRYAFGWSTIEALEKWFYLVRNPETGGVGLTSAVKTDGLFQWIIPSQPTQEADIRGNAISSQNTMQTGMVYYLEGCLLTGLKFSDADMTASGKVNCDMSIMIDRYYPESLDNMQMS